MTNEEKIIAFLLEKFEKSSTNEIKIFQSDVPKINLHEQEIIRALYVLQEDGYINIKQKSIHDDFSRFWEIALKSSCVHYFENKKASKKEKCFNWIQFLIPVVISVIALIIAA